MNRGHHFRYTPRLMFFLALFGPTLVTALCGNGFAESKSTETTAVVATTEMIRQLGRSAKLNLPERILEPLETGKETTRVIVELVKPVTPGLGALKKEFRKPGVRNQIRSMVTTAQDMAMDALDLAEVRITNRFTYIFGFSAEVTLPGLASLVNHANVVSIEKDSIIEAHLAQGISLINAGSVRSTYNGKGMSIAICDTGIDYTHPRLGGGCFPNSKVIGGYDTGQNDADPMDGNGHGTACAGIAAGDLELVGDYIGGVANNAKLYALKMTYTSTNRSAYLSDMVQAWEWCVTHQNDDPGNPIMIISTSFGSGYFTSQSNCDAYSSAMTTAAANARTVGITIFASTGNDGYCDGTSWPGCLSDVIGVGAVYEADIGRYPDPGHVGCISTLSCSGYTSICPCVTENCYIDYMTAADQVTTYSNSASFVSLFAPSNDAYTTDVGGGYKTDFGGTSAACPYAAGAGAALQSAAMAKNGAYLTPDQVKSILVNTGDLVTDSKVAITKPRVNLGNAIASVVGKTGRNIAITPIILPLLLDD